MLWLLLLFLFCSYFFFVVVVVVVVVGVLVVVVIIVVVVLVVVLVVVVVVVVVVAVVDKTINKYTKRMNCYTSFLFIKASARPQALFFSKLNSKFRTNDEQFKKRQTNQKTDEEFGKQHFFNVFLTFLNFFLSTF